MTEEGLMESIIDPTGYPLVVHGTYAQNWKSIYKNGLMKMKRNHIRIQNIYLRFNNSLTKKR